MAKQLGVLTGGGDCPGLNAAIRAVVRGALARGYEVVGIRHGWRGLVEGDFVPLTRSDIAGILPRGGTILGTTGFDPLREEEHVAQLLRNAAALDALVAIGGDGTLGRAARLHGEHGLPVVCVPKTIDNDVGGTDATIGFDTAVAIATEAIDRLHTTAESHDRVMVIEVMGRHAGWIALESGIAGGADIILIPEEPLPVEEVCACVDRRHLHGQAFSIVVVAEGWPLTTREGVGGLVAHGTDEYGFLRLGGVGAMLGAEVAARTGFETRVTVLGHVQRGGTPTARDRVLATRLGLHAVELAATGSFGVVVGLHGDTVAATPLADAIAASPRTVPPATYAAARTLFD
ncbi:MAG: ATP-dependent 6-phosphofructokinase [Thermoleophilia bacterium]